MHYYIVYGSITYANRIRDFFSGERGFVGVAHTPSSISASGCSYSVRLTADKLDRALDASKQFGIRILGVYRDNGDGNFTEVAR